MRHETKIAVRTLAAPIVDVTAFDSIVQAVLAINPFGCVDCMQIGITAWRRLVKT